MSDTTSTPPYRTDRVRLMFLLRKKAGLSDQEFQDHWRTVHANLFAAMPLARTNLLKYEIVSRTPVRLASLAVSSGLG